MSKKKKTIMAMVVDRSTSMRDTAAQAEQNYNETVAQMKEYAKDQDIYCCLVTFSDNVFENLWLVRAEEVQPMKPGDFVCGGWTAFRDGVGHTIKRLKEMERESLDAGEDIAFLISIISDGGENASTHIGEQELLDLVNEAEGTQRWTFMYMGCSPSNLKEVQRMTGIPISNMAVWSNVNPEEAAYGYNSSRGGYQSFMECRSKGLVQQDCLYSADVMSFADFTTSGSTASPDVSNNNDSLENMISSSLSGSKIAKKDIPDLNKLYKSMIQK